MRQADSIMMQRHTRPMQQAAERDVVELSNAIEMALCHISELIGMAHEIACEMHGGMSRSDAVLHVSGRLATLMHSAAREVDLAQQVCTALIQNRPR